MLRVFHALCFAFSMRVLAAFSMRVLALTRAVWREQVYKTVSKNRYRFFGQSDECR